MRLVLRTAFGLFLPALLLSGCQKVSEQKTVTVGPGGDVKAPMILTAPSREQDVTLTVSSNAPVDVYIALEKEVPGLDKGEFKVPKNSLVSEKSVDKEKTLKAKVPAQSGYVVVVANNGSKEASVTLKLEGK